MLIRRDAALVVDAYSTGAMFAPAFMAHGIQCVHVRSTENIRPNLKATGRPQDFELAFTYQDDADLKARLQGLSVRWVLAGCEEGVELAAHIADRLEVPFRNDGQHWQRWRNKYAMHEALHAAGVSGIRHFKTSHLDSIDAWACRAGVPYPLVLKPVDSAGSDNVHICHDAQSVEAAFRRILACRNALLQNNTEVLVQEYLRNNELKAPGSCAPAERREDNVDVEYCINTVSHDGTHYVTEIIKVYRTRIDDAPVHDYNELLCPVAEAWAYQVFAEYIERVLNALGIRNGPAHSELMVVDTCPVLLECAARLPGGIDLSAYTKALGTNQLMLTVQACIDPPTFLRHAASPRTPLRSHSSCVFLISDREGEITGAPDIGAWRSIPTLHSLKLRERGRLERTDALFNAPGQLFLLADDKSQLRRDRQRVREHESVVYASLLSAEATTVS
jgi:hypothetical protein